MMRSAFSALARSFGALGLVACAAALSGCQCGPPPEPGADAPVARAPTSDGTAVIEGRVVLAEGAELPSTPDNPMVGGPRRPELPEACTPPRMRDRQPVSMLEDRRLVGVLVGLHEFAATPEHEPVTHEMVIRDCRLEPRFLVATRGDRLRVTNETDYPFLPDFGGGLMQVLLHERSREIELTEGDVRTLTCGFAAPCGQAEIVTFYHPLHAITDDEGRFRIERVPAGEELRVSAWHPLFEEASERLTLRPGQTHTIELVLRPKEVAPVPEAPPEASPEGPTPAAGEDEQDVLF